MTVSPSDAIVNTSPLIYLDKINSLDLLSKVYATVFTTPAVLEEISAGQEGEILVDRLRKLSWFRIVESVAVPQELMQWDLGRGETSIIAWAIQNPAALLIIDDRAAYLCARLHELKASGTIGVLLAAKGKGLLKEIRSPLNALIQAGCWISEDVIQTALHLAGEKE